LHSAAISLTVVSAISGLLSAIGFVTVNWAGPIRRVVIAILFFSVVAFLAGVSSSILTAARDTYARRSTRD
jgi:hypothetical protein